MTHSISIAENLSAIQSRIGAACQRAGRSPQEVRLIAVSKTKPFSAVQAAQAVGMVDFGENYVQELTEKIHAWQALPPQAQQPVRWHMIGHLQKNKVKYLIGNVALIHSVDSLPLAECIEKEAAKQDALLNILLEINAAAEESKWGFSLAEAMDAARAVASLPHLRLQGLMTSAPFTEDPESNRPYFRSMKELSREMHSLGLFSFGSEPFPFPILSMGMSGDFEVAIEEGATMVRVGTSIFGARDYSSK
ncbi:MAG: YggS family pyridoxal phosphate-dependent enzyme [Clostridia bacterium]|nr:YggS family pyridoxal phosphate-dependent enzyme [Clostridia bacterium]